ncbi:YcxB family protein [Streptomyces sp. NPDC001262]|uniref:YcxB family protein n=1 Tax=unclassified Streptomyces TaxID=2593676 RepID=UPI0036B408C8
MSESVTAAESVALEFELTVADLRAGMRARARAVRKVRVLNWVLGAALVMMAWGLGLHISRDGVGGVSPREWALAAFLALFFAQQVLGLQAYYARGRLRQHGPRRVTLDAQGVTCTGAGSSSTQAWSQFGCHVERGDLFVLLSADRRCLTVLPKRGLAAPGAADRLRALLATHVPRA